MGSASSFSRSSPTIVHFSGHGAGRIGIGFHGDLPSDDTVTDETARRFAAAFYLRGPIRPQLPAVQTLSQPVPMAVALTEPIADVALAKEAEEERELRKAILMAEQSGTGDAPSLIQLISRLAAKANLMPPGKRS